MSFLAACQPVPRRATDARLADKRVRWAETQGGHPLPGKKPWVRCARCKLETEPDGRHCIRCGAPLRLRCRNCSWENPPGANFCGGCAAALAPVTDAVAGGAAACYVTAIEAENAMLAARSFRVVGTIVFLFQFLFVAADHAAMAQYLHFFWPLYAINAVDALCALLVTRARWFPRYWKPLALVQVGLLDLTGTIMNLHSGTLTPHFYTIITFSIGCATFLPWGVIWQSMLNLVCLVSYVAVCLNATSGERYLYYQWITLAAVLILSEFPAAFIDQYRRRLFGQLQELARALNASRDKSEFLASMSHEMRTPLNTIIGMIEVLEAGEVRPEQMQYLNVCRASGDALIGLINDIVDISRIEAGELHLDHVAFDLCELVDNMADAMALRAQRKGLELIFNVTQGTPTRLLGDPMRLRQVCFNLLVNAIKFTDEGEVVMRVEPDRDSRASGVLRFCVADTGVGIAPEEQKRIFSRFARTARGTDRHEGSGLGLEISKRLVEAMGGRIWVESMPGMGSTFYFTCRMEMQLGAEDDSAGKTSLAGKRVLVVDDNAASRAALSEMLSGAGASLALCADAGQARQELSASRQRAGSYDVILLDGHLMPDNGSELARKFGHPASTIVMLTSEALPDAARMLREGGIGRYLLKPIKQAELLEAVTAVAASASTRAAGSSVEPERACKEDRSGLRILLAEDSEENRLLIAAYLRGSAHQLDTAENGRIAVEMFKAASYDLVLVDVNMPVLDGYSAVAAMRQWERAQGASPTPVLALTGRAMVEDRARSLAAGCNGHLTKPLRRAVLTEAISRFTKAASAG